jgi:hypothetical protein
LTFSGAAARVADDRAATRCPEQESNLRPTP